jgi:hypothetical protein
MYTVDFDAGVFGVPDTGSTLLLHVQVFGTGTPLDETVTPPSADTFDPNSVIFKHYHFTFTADSITTTLQFSDIGVGNAGADTVVDTVSVALQPTPTPGPRSATWKASPATGDWNTASNWTPATIPNGPSDTATFASSNTTGVSLSASTEVNGIVFNAGASAFTITASPAFITLTISGVGITNNSGIMQNFVTAVDGAGNSGFIAFANSATAGSLTAFTNNGGAVNASGGGGLFFNDTSTAGESTFTNNGGAVSGAGGGFTFFSNSATAGNGTFTNNGGAVNGALGGETHFFDTSTAASGTFTTNGGAVSAFVETVFHDTSTAGSATLIANGGLGGGDGGLIIFEHDSLGGTARVEVFGNGTGDSTNGNLDISFHNAPGLTTGSIEGSGAVFLGAFNLTVGSNNLSTIFSGVIQDGGQNGGTGGSLTKTGKRKLTLTKANTYTGGTTITKGTLLVKNKTGSATGTGAVQVNVGSLQGVGKISGAVTVGTGSSSGAILLAGNSATSPGTLTINNTLTFNSLSTYKCVLKRTTAKASKAVALGVTIGSNVPFTFVDTGTGTLTTGTVFTVVSNTSASPIAGTFSNLANGLVFASNGNNFQVSYTGGTGNDLTLTVVPSPRRSNVVSAFDRAPVPEAL